jgi:hypothetical protein
MLDEPHHEAAPVTREQALQRAKYWVVHHYGEPEYQWERKESRDLAAELATRAVAIALQNGESAVELEEKLAYCIRLVENLKYLGRSSAISWIFDKQETERTESEKTKVSLHGEAVWRRYNVADSFQRGNESAAYFDGNKDQMVHMAAEYLSRPWARHGMVDWILLDLMITREACLYGEHIKMAGLPGVTGDYFKHNGDLAKMRGDVTARTTLILFQLVLGWVIPLAAIWFAFDRGYKMTGWTFVALFALSTAWWLLMLTIRFGIRIYWYATGKTDPAKRPLEIAMAMHDVWKSLEGPVVNPTMVKESMLKAKEKGALWDGAAWSIIDRAITIDPAVMMTKTKS